MYTSPQPCTARQLFRLARLQLCRRLVPQWHGTRAHLRRAVTCLLKPYRRHWRTLLAILNNPRRAALFAATFGVALTATTTQARAAASFNLSTIAAGTGGFAINGVDADNSAGQTVAPLSDINGDGLADILIGAPFAYDAPSSPGSAYVVFGKPTTSAVNLTSVTLGHGGFVVTGPAGGPNAAYNVAVAGDINGDGIPDLLVNAEDLHGSGTGVAFVVFGKADTTSVSLTNVAAGHGGFKLVTSGTFNFFPYSLMGSADINGDGLDDIVLGAPGGASPHVYVVFGKKDGLTVQMSDIAQGHGGFVINPVAGDLLGRSVAIAGDVNGDGLPDLILGAPQSSPNGSASGRAYVVFGKTDTTSVSLSNVVNGIGGFVINGPNASAYAGKSVAGAGDVNGDGLSDLIIGAPGPAATSNPNPGKAYVIFGKRDTNPVNLAQIPANRSGYVIIGEAAHDETGLSVAGVGDINGDGLADVLIGAPHANSNGTYSTGRAYLVYGKADFLSLLLSDVYGGVGGFAMTGEALKDSAGYAVAGPGDVNGDGVADLLVGAPVDAANGNHAAGRAYVIFSPAVPPASSTYFTHERPGDGPGGTIVPPTEFPDARIKIKYPDNDTASDGAGHASETTVTLTRSKASISGSGLPATPTNIANVMWRVISNRTPFTSASITFKYLDNEIAGFAGPPSDWFVYQASAPTGPWTPLSTTFHTTPHTAQVNALSLGYFTLASLATPTPTPTPTPTATPTPTPPPVIPYLLGKTTDSTGLDVNNDGKVDIGDAIYSIKHPPK